MTAPLRARHPRAYTGLRRALSGLVIASVLGPGGSGPAGVATATASPAGSAPAVAADEPARRQPALRARHDDAPPPGVDVRRRVSTDELVRRTGAGRARTSSLRDTAPTVRAAPLPAAADAAVNPGSAAATSTTAAATAPAGTPTNPALRTHVAPSCAGSGSDGPRVQVLYAHRAGTASRLAALAPSIRSWTADVDDALSLSARKTGGERRVRWLAGWLPDGSCTPRLTGVAVSGAALADMDTMVSELWNRGVDRADRKYLVFADANTYCGIGQQYDDSSPTEDNFNNGTAAMFARVDNACWSTPGYRSVAAHEVMHTLGAVNDDSPHHTTNGHCTDGRDLMCYADGSPQRFTTTSCPLASSLHVFDCRNDDYFAVTPAGTYLRTHWNTANSRFLDRAVPRPGLSGSYWSNADFTGTRLKRRDPVVDFRWTGEPLAGVGADTFSVRWTGRLLVPTKGTYTLYGTSNAGMRIYLDGRLVVDDWSPHLSREKASAPLPLGAGKHVLRVEQYETTGYARARLAWSGPGIAKQVVPSNRLSTA